MTVTQPRQATRNTGTPVRHPVVVGIAGLTRAAALRGRMAEFAAAESKSTWLTLLLLPSPRRRDGRPALARVLAATYAALGLLLMAAIGTSVPGYSPARSAWTGLYAVVVVALLCLASAIPHRPVRTALGLVSGGLFGWAAHASRTGDLGGRRWFVLSPFLFAAILIRGLVEDPLHLFDSGIGAGDGRHPAARHHGRSCPLGPRPTLEPERQSDSRTGHPGRLATDRYRSGRAVGHGADKCLDRPALRRSARRAGARSIDTQQLTPGSWNRLDRAVSRADLIPPRLDGRRPASLAGRTRDTDGSSNSSGEQR